MLALAVYLLGIGVPETYGREILRSRARRRGLAPPNLTKALSGVTFAEMARVTFFTPLKMLIAEPVVMLITLYLGLNFAVIFQFFITVPIVLNVVAGFTVQQAGLAFNAAIGGAVIAAMTSILIDRIAFPRAVKNGHNGMASIEYRLIPAMFGGFGLFASLFWIGFTAKPTISYISPVLGTGLYVWGNLSVLVSRPLVGREVSPKLTNALRSHSFHIFSTPTHPQELFRPSPSQRLFASSWLV